MLERIITPPMVGVPFFLRWVSGPQSRTTCPRWNFLSSAMVFGPMRSVKTSAVRSDMTARKVW